MEEKVSELLSSWLLIDAKCNLLGPQACLSSHTAMANNTLWRQHCGAWQQLVYTIMS